MAFFQFRKSREEQAAAKLAPTQTVEAIRRRAMHRLIGAAVLVLAGVIGFPLVFDNQPRPIPVDLPIEIADKAKVKPLVAPPATPVTVAAASGAVVTLAADPEPASPAKVAAPATTLVPAPPAPDTAKLSPPATEKAATEKTVAEKPAAEKPAVKTADANKAQALLEGKDVSATAPSADTRFVVQVGAFADAGKVREVRQKVEGAGLKTYTQVVETKDGSRTRIRVGPFPDKAQATQVAEKIKKLDLAAVILSL